MARFLPAFLATLTIVATAAANDRCTLHLVHKTATELQFKVQRGLRPELVTCTTRLIASMVPLLSTYGPDGDHLLNWQSPIAPTSLPVVVLLYGEAQLSKVRSFYKNARVGFRSSDSWTDFDTGRGIFATVGLNVDRMVGDTQGVDGARLSLALAREIYGPLHGHLRGTRSGGTAAAEDERVARGAGVAFVDRFFAGPLDTLGPYAAMLSPLRALEERALRAFAP